jgi:hypothetical protein
VDATVSTNMPCKAEKTDDTITRGFGHADNVELLRSNSSGEKPGAGVQTEKRSHWERRRKSAVEIESWEVQKTWGSP